eukprot:515400_1
MLIVHCWNHCCEPMSEPQLIKSIKEYNIKHISCGHRHSVAISATKVFVWGDNRRSQCGLGINTNEHITTPTIIDIDTNNNKKQLLPLYAVCGTDHTLLLTAKGLLLSWGGGNSDGNNGQLGHGSREPQHTPKIIESLNVINIIYISAGGYHSLCVDKNGNIYSFGRGKYGRLGHGNESDVDTP